MDSLLDVLNTKIERYLNTTYFVVLPSKLRFLDFILINEKFLIKTHKE